MKTEKSYIIITRYAGRGKNITALVLNTIEEALKEAQEELKADYVDSVEIYQSDKAQYCFFVKLMFKYVK